MPRLPAAVLPPSGCAHSRAGSQDLPSRARSPRPLPCSGPYRSALDRAVRFGLGLAAPGQEFNPFGRRVREELVASSAAMSPTAVSVQSPVASGSPPAYPFVSSLRAALVSSTLPSVSIAGADSNSRLARTDPVPGADVSAAVPPAEEGGASCARVSRANAVAVCGAVASVRLSGGGGVIPHFRRIGSVRPVQCGPWVRLPVRPARRPV
ncbi:hypothetical protein KEM55_005024 [Ascosphaera atra]|nr:hypothetical protein KEM55_005024 [Ascosphaera atra]